MKLKHENKNNGKNVCYKKDFSPLCGDRWTDFHDLIKHDAFCPVSVAWTVHQMGERKTNLTFSNYLPKQSDT